MGGATATQNRLRYIYAKVTRKGSVDSFPALEASPATDKLGMIGLKDSGQPEELMF